MNPPYFNCLICNTPCQPLHNNIDDQHTTVDGLFVHATGNYGSEHFDPLPDHNKYLEAVICNNCVLAKHTHFRTNHQGRLIPWRPFIPHRQIIPDSLATFHYDPLSGAIDYATAENGVLITFPKNARLIARPDATNTHYYGPQCKSDNLLPAPVRTDNTPCLIIDTPGERRIINLATGATLPQLDR